MDLTKKRTTIFCWMVLLTLLPSICLTNNCELVGGTNNIYFIGVENDPNKFSQALNQHTSNTQFSLAIWFRVLHKPFTGKKGVIASYGDLLYVYSWHDGSELQVRVWAKDGSPTDKVIATAPIAYNRWTLIWVEIDASFASPKTYVLVRDQPGQTGVIENTLSKISNLTF